MNGLKSILFYSYDLIHCNIKERTKLVIKVGIMGFDFKSSNKGCEALTYSFINLLIECFGENLSITNYSYGTLGVFPKKYPKLKFLIRRPQIKNPIDCIKLKNEMANFDIIFDVTFGDGFSDIYGKKWNFTTDMLKQIAIWSGTPLVLLPQTYGPYENKLLRRWAVHIVEKSALAFSRDKQSAEEMDAFGCSKVVTITDLAFALPYNKNLYHIKSSKLKIGLNVSSLLWDGGHNIKLRTNYKEYCRKFLSIFSSRDNVELHLIPHVINLENPDSLENDSRVCKLLYDEFPHTVLAPDFETPMEAKSYISNMDIFIGARMHSTIGAISASVATIPFAYSKKFKSLFGVLDYPYVIEARELNTDDALEITLKWIRLRVDLQQAAQRVQEKTIPRLNELKTDIKGLYGRMEQYV